MRLSGEGKHSHQKVNSPKQRSKNHVVQMWRFWDLARVVSRNAGS